MRAMERLEVVEARLKATEKDFEDSKVSYKEAKDKFDKVKALRFELFNKAFSHIQEQISQVYKDLTRSEQYPLGGQAYLDIEEDEVDAALDNANVEKIKNYIRDNAGPGMQFIVISLKTGLFQDSESLVGVYRDQDVNSSRTLTLDLRKYV
ncbi:P-loop containing nucleoside triphosphate hydrolase protein [Biscogniauxia mediterranea]|nr:P-loop containing nucleoside triphosphate hydrolase protein [Biscogniauxia mediterranea]